jgi:hypothetical protein
MRGNLKLRSGVWEWVCIEVRDAASGKLESRHFSFHRDGSPGSLMRQTFRGSMELDEELLALGVRHPDLRELRSEDGEVWTFFELGYPGQTEGALRDFEAPPCETVFRSEGGGYGRGRLPHGYGLGEVTDQELLSLIESHGGSRGELS